MKVHLYGNTLNNSYNLAIFLRKQGIDAHFFLDNLSPFDQDFPWWEDKNLSKNNLPDWIHYFPSKPFFLFPGKTTRNLIKEFGKCDIALVCGFGPIVAMKAKVPFVFYSIGSDLNCIDVREELISLLKARGTLKAKLLRLVKIITYTPLQKKAIVEKANKILVLMGYQVNPYINKFGLAHKTSVARLAWDINKYAITPDEVLTEKYKSFNIVFFMIARHQFSSVWLDVKGNDKFLEAFAAFVKEGKKNVKLILINKGTDVHLSEKIIEKHQIQDYIEWVEMMDKDGIRAYESIPNCVVVDQFWHDDIGKRYTADNGNPKMGFGSGSVEAMAASKPLITAFTDQKFYGNNTPPILAAFTAKEILVRLHEVYNMSAESRAEMGKMGHDFIMQWHDYTNTLPLYINAMQDVLKELKNKANVVPE